MFVSQLHSCNAQQNTSVKCASGSTYCDQIGTVRLAGRVCLCEGSLLPRWCRQVSMHKALTLKTCPHVQSALGAMLTLHSCPQVQSRRHEDGSAGGSIKPGFCFLNHDPSSAPLFGWAQHACSSHACAHAGIEAVHCMRSSTWNSAPAQRCTKPPFGWHRGIALHTPCCSAGWAETRSARMRATAQTLCSCCCPTGLAHPSPCGKASMHALQACMSPCFRPAPDAASVGKGAYVLPLRQHSVQSLELHALPTPNFSLVDAGEELFTCYKASTSACTESDLEDRLIRWGFPLPQPQASQGDPSASCTMQ